MIIVIFKIPGGRNENIEKCVMDVPLREGPTLSKDLKRLAGFGGDGLKGFDTVITNLQMQTYVTVHCFEYAHDKHGRPYGWGIAKSLSVNREYSATSKPLACNGYRPKREFQVQGFLSETSQNPCTWQVDSCIWRHE